MRTLLISLFSLAIVGSAAAKPKDIGPQPSWEKAKAIAVQVVGENLKDDQSARYEWRGEGWNQTKKAWVICGRVNSKNSYGGYAGWQQFKMTYVNGISTGIRFAPLGAGFNECNSAQGYHADGDF